LFESQPGSLLQVAGCPIRNISNVSFRLCAFYVQHRFPEKQIPGRAKLLLLFAAHDRPSRHRLSRRYVEPFHAQSSRNR
jgi:hypothetical protein